MDQGLPESFSLHGVRTQYSPGIRGGGLWCRGHTRTPQASTLASTRLESRGPPQVEVQRGWGRKIHLRIQVEAIKDS